MITAINFLYITNRTFNNIKSDTRILFVSNNSFIQIIQESIWKKFNILEV